MATATTSLGKAKYFLTFVDDYYWFVWTFTIKPKDEVYGELIDFQSMMLSLMILFLVVF
jgi:hypothetical protein